MYENLSLRNFIHLRKPNENSFLNANRILNNSLLRNTFSIDFFLLLYVCINQYFMFLSLSELLSNKSNITIKTKIKTNIHINNNIKYTSIIDLDNILY